jgi:hypothetical protein
MPKQKRTIEVAGFGLLRHRAADLWERPIAIDFAGRHYAVPLFVDISKTLDGPDANQLAAYEHFSGDIAAAARAAETALVEHVRSISPPPAAAPSQEALATVELEAVSFPYARPRPTFGFLFASVLEPEHGLAVKFENGRVAAVGTQDILL